MQKSSKMFVLNSVGFWRLQWHISSQTSIECFRIPPPCPGGFANLSPAVASTCYSSLAGVSCGNPMHNPTCLRTTLLNSPHWLMVIGDETGLTFQLISTPSLPTQFMKSCTTPLGSMPLTLYLPQETEQWKVCEMRPMEAYGFSSLSAKIRLSNHFVDYTTKAANSPQLF